MKIEKGFIFRNWARNQHCKVETCFFPTSEEQLVSIVKDAFNKQKKMRVVGSGHSWSAIACSNEWMINLEGFCAVHGIDQQKKTITVQAGMKLKDLNEYLFTNGLALPNIGSISEQSVAGLIATGTHGTGINFGSISTMVKALRVVQADGSIVEISEEKDDDLINAYRLNLGCLGIVSTITFQCVKAFNLKEISYPMNFDETISKMNSLVRENDHVKFWWFPHQDEIMVYTYHRTSVPEVPLNPVTKWFERSFLVNYTFSFLLWFGKQFPDSIPAVNHFIRMLHHKKRERVERSFEVFNVPMPPRHLECEYAFTANSAPSVLSRLKEQIDKNHLKINFLIELRFVKGDEIWMSPAYKRDSCFLGVYQAGEHHWSEYMDIFENMMKKNEGRPHWGKSFKVDSAVLKERIPKYSEFKALKRKTDPQNLFGNRMTSQVFGD